MNKIVVNQDIILIDLLSLSFNRKKAKSLLKYHQVSLNNQTISQFDYQLHPGDVVFINQKTTNLPFDILYEDNQLLVINKPSGLLSMATSNEKEKTAYHLVGEYLKSKDKKAKVFIVHRLDRDTSGVLMFAKNEMIKNKLQANWNNLVFKRGYLAIVEGKFGSLKGTLKNYLQESKTKQVYIAKSGKLAITHYQVLKMIKNYSLLEIYLDTGRKNQIRVQMQNINHSIVGDKKYGAKTNPIKRLGLHAHVLGFIHPDTKKKMEFVAPTPSVFKQLFDSIK